MAQHQSMYLSCGPQALYPHLDVAGEASSEAMGLQADGMILAEFNRWLPSIYRSDFHGFSMKSSSYWGYPHDYGNPHIDPYGSSSGNLT